MGPGFTFSCLPLFTRTVSPSGDPETLEAVLPTYGAITPRNDVSYYVGFSFTVGAAPVTVTHVGVHNHAGNTQTHEVCIVDSSGNILATADVDATLGVDDEMQYVELASPLVLSAATVYGCHAEQFAAGDYWGNAMAITTTADIDPTTATFQTTSGGAISTNTADFAFGPTSFRYHL